MMALVTSCCSTIRNISIKHKPRSGETTGDLIQLYNHEYYDVPQTHQHTHTRSPLLVLMPCYGLGFTTAMNL